MPGRYIHPEQSKIFVENRLDVWLAKNR